MKRILACSTGLLGGAVLAASAATAQEIRVATVVSAPHPWIDAAEVFKEEVEAHTDYTVEIYPGGQLGDDETVVDEMRIGTVDVTIGGVGNISPFVPEFEFFALSYLFADMDGFRAVTDRESEVFAFFHDVVAEADVGLELLALTGGGTRNLSTAEGPVTHPDDLDGVRMRTTGAQLDQDTWGALGAVTTSLPWTELYSAVQTGVVSAFESTISGYVGSNLFEVAPYHSKTEHQVMMSHISMASLRWDQLSEDEREVIVRAADMAGRHGTEMGVQYDAELIEELADRGVTVSEVDAEAFMAATGALHEEYAAELGLSDLLETVRALQ